MMEMRLYTINFFIAGIVGIPLVVAFFSHSFSSLPHQSSSVTSHDRVSPFVFVSDTQDPLWVETLFLEENRNTEARARIFESILADQPAALFHCGDLVALGSLGSEWGVIDSFLTQLRSRSIPFYPALGNHDLLLFPRIGRENFAKRSPVDATTGYVRRLGPVAVIMLNSNFFYLCGAEERRQQAWYEETLDALDADSDVKWIIVGCHHSPYTNSTIISPSSSVQQHFVPAYVKSRKGVLFLSGHSHAFEHFIHSGKDFMVIGGGGGLQHPLRRGSEARWTDLFPENSSLRRFHYLRCSIERGELVVEVQMLTKNFSGTETIYRVSFPDHQEVSP